MRTVVDNTDIGLDNITLLEFVEYLFSVLVGLWSMEERMMCYYAQKLSKAESVT